MATQMQLAREGKITDAMKIVAEDEKLSVEQKDTMEYVNNMAMMYGMPPVQLFEELRKNPGSYAGITQQIIANKVNEFLLNNNKFIAK